MSPLRIVSSVAPVQDEAPVPPQQPVSGIRNIRDLLSPCEACRVKAASAPLCEACTHRRRIAQAMPPPPLPTPPAIALCRECQGKHESEPLCPVCEGEFRHQWILAYVHDHPA